MGRGRPLPTAAEDAAGSRSRSGWREPSRRELRGGSIGGRSVGGLGLVLVAALVGTACGGSGGRTTFDETALRARILERSPAASAAAIDATVDVVRNASASGDRRAISQLHDEDPNGYDLARFACPQKIAEATATSG